MASIRKRPDRPKPWEAVWRDPDGRQRTRSFPRKSDAQRYLTSIESDKLRGAYVDPSAGKVTFAVFARQWAAAQTVDASTREGTDCRLRAHLLPAFGDLELRAIRPSTVQQWLAGVSRTRAPGTVRLLLATLSTASTRSATITPASCSMRACRSAPWPTTSATLTLGSRYRPLTSRNARHLSAWLTPGSHEKAASTA